MRSPSEHHSRAVAYGLLAAILLCLTPAARAQAPTCAWGDGVLLPGTEGRKLGLASDGGAGLLVVSSPFIGTDTPLYMVGTLRLHHVLEQGRLDPSRPEQGVT